jgi:hypothetical protein
MAHPTDKQIMVEAFPLNPAGNAYGSEIERVSIDNELIIATWSPVHLRNKLRELYWKPEKSAVGAMLFWEDTQRYLYLPRLKDRTVLAQAIVKGAATKDFFGTAYGQTADGFEGFKFGDANIQLDDTLLLIEPEAAKTHEAALAAKAAAAATVAPSGSGPTPTGTPVPLPPTTGGTAPAGTGATPAPQPKAKAFYGSAEVNASTAKMRLVQIAEEIIAVLASDPNATVKVSVEISAEYPHGASDQIKRAVSENAGSLNFNTKTWE